MLAEMYKLVKRNAWATALAFCLCELGCPPTTWQFWVMGGGIALLVIWQYETG